MKEFIKDFLILLSTPFYLIVWVVLAIMYLAKNMGYRIEELVRRMDWIYER